MENAQDFDELQQAAASMVVLEHQIEESLVQCLQEVQEHVEAAKAITRFQTLAAGQRKALVACLKRIGGGEPGFASSIAPYKLTTASNKGGLQAVSKALHAIAAEFNHAAFGYAIMHTVAHRFNDRTGEWNAADMAEQHQLSYIEASQVVYRLIPDVVLSEMGTNGECRCTCPSCGLGICLCRHAHLDSFMPVSPSDEGGIQVRLPKADSAAFQAGLRQGDVILAVDGQNIQTYQDLQAEIRKHGPGDAVQLQTLRGTGGTQEIIVTYPT